MSNLQQLQFDSEGNIIDPNAVTVELTKPEGQQSPAVIRDLDAERKVSQQTSAFISGKAQADQALAVERHAALSVEYENDEQMISALDELGDDASAEQRAQRKRLKEARVHARHDLAMAWVRAGNPISDIDM